jgi:hypothetical protein
MLEHADTLPPMALVAAANSAFKIERTTDGLFLYCAFTIRSLYELERFPIDETKREQLQALFVSRMMLEGSVKQALQYYRSWNQETVDRLTSWTIVVPDNYEPGWEHIGEQFTDDDLSIFNEIKNRNISKIQAM